MALAIARTLGRGWEEPGMTLGSTAVGEDAQSIWDTAKLGSCVAPGPCQELHPGLSAMGSSPWVRGETLAGICQKL